MKVPLSWLGTLVEWSGTPAELAERLNGAGLECELRAGASVPEGVVTGRIVSCERHPNADRLSVCRVDVGGGDERDIVCGAPNVEAGKVGAVALPGTDLGDFVVAGRALRGVTSSGMLCSEKELGISDDHAGVIMLAGDTPVGRPLGEVLGGEAVLETYPSANRGDLMSVAGVAREVSAISGRRWEPSVSRAPRVDGPGDWSVAIEDPEDCPRYGGRIIEGLVPGPSPQWLADRLSAAGVRPIMNLVDVTNYVLLELGHPLHAFDLEKLEGRVIGVRRSRSPEKLVTLDEQERELGDGTLVITDGSGPVATGGIMGGESTRVSESTRAIFLEGASFRPERIRAGSRGMRLVTDASARFERGVDPEGVPGALDRCVELFLELCPGAKLAHAVDAYPAPVSAKRVNLRRRTLRRILGVDLPPKEVRRVLETLGLTIVEENEESWDVEAPPLRRDLVAEEDLVEEVARIHGYDRFPERAQVHALPEPLREPRMESLWRARSILLSTGLTEVVTPSLIEGEREAALVAGDDFFRRPVPLRNPLTQDRDCLRGSLVPSLVQVLATNRARASADLAVFEVGRAFGAASDGAVAERLRAGVLLAGRGLGAVRGQGSNSCDFFDMKGLLEVYVEEYWGMPLRLKGAGPFPMSPARSAAVVVDGTTVGYLGEPAPAVRKSFDLPADLPVLIAELDLESRAAAAGEVLFERLPRYPGVVRDLAFVVEKRRRHAELADALRTAGGGLLAEVRLFDVYEGPPLAETEKNLAYTLVFRSPDRSLTHEEVDEVVTRMAARLEKDLGARIR